MRNGYNLIVVSNLIYTENIIYYENAHTTKRYAKNRRNLSRPTLFRKKAIGAAVCLQNQ